MIIDFVQTQLTRALPVYAITVRLAATIFAYELGAWDGKDFTDAEVEPFFDPHQQRADGFPTTNPHGWENLELTGSPLEARMTLESLLCADINAGRLSTLQERRDLKGIPIAKETLLNIDEVRHWATAYGLDPGDSFNQYYNDEIGVAYQALAAIKEEWAFLQDPTKLERARSLVQAGDVEAIRKIMADNVRLRTALNASTQAESQMDPRAQTSLLRIIGALLQKQGLDASKPYEAAAEIEKMAPGLSKNTIATHLKSVRGAMK